MPKASMLQRVYIGGTAAACDSGWMRQVCGKYQYWPCCLIDHPVAVGRQTNQETRGRKGACERLAPCSKAAVAPTGAVCTKNFGKGEGDGHGEAAEALLF
ncbi:hypothetical protein ACSS6W_000711 [Trichoderma asperelloides]